jgi:hypothetical protein
VRPVLPWIAAYVAILLGWAIIVLRRTGPTLWKGRSLVALNLAFVVISTAPSVLEARSLGHGIDELFQCCVARGIIVFDLVLLLVALAVGRTWLLLGVTHADTNKVLERCFKQTRAPSTVRKGGYTVQCGDAEMIVTIQPISVTLLGVRFTGARRSKKAALIRKLFGKQYHSSFRTPRFRA